MARKKLRLLVVFAVLLGLAVCGLAGGTFYALRLPEHTGDQDTIILGQNRLVPGAPGALPGGPGGVGMTSPGAGLSDPFVYTGAGFLTGMAPPPAFCSCAGRWRPRPVPGCRYCAASPAASATTWPLMR